MALQASYSKKIFQFNFQARTSRGLMRDKTSWFIKIWDDSDPEIIGIGECGPLPGLSPEEGPDFENKLREVIKNLSDPTLQDLNASTPQQVKKIISPNFPAILFAMETALLDLMHGGKRIIFANDFVQGKPIPINGLIWMGDFDFMVRQVDQKIAQGFRCIKLKVGGLDFDQECEVLDYIRRRYFKEDITIRLDANGAFHVGEALHRLHALKKFHIHSIEQPIEKGLSGMKDLCRDSPIPVAFDEELIACETDDKRKLLLTQLKPQFITLKPTLHGGLSGCKSWIEIAESLGIGWWITSALESNIGLNAICQFAANYALGIPQGLGTGTLYQNNFESPLKVENGYISMDTFAGWNVDLD